MCYIGWSWCWHVYQEHVLRWSWGGLPYQEHVAGWSWCGRTHIGIMCQDDQDVGVQIRNVCQDDPDVGAHIYTEHVPGWSWCGRTHIRNMCYGMILMCAHMCGTLNRQSILEFFTHSQSSSGQQCQPPLRCQLLSWIMVSCMFLYRSPTSKLVCPMSAHMCHCAII